MDMTTCARCNRAVYTTDVNADGLCVLCAPAPKPAKPPKAEKVGKDEA